MILYTLKETVATTRNQGRVEALQVDGVCGENEGPVFEAVVIIVEPRSQNPGFKTKNFIGVSGILTIIQLLKDWRQRNGITEELKGPALG